MEMRYILSSLVSDLESIVFCYSKHFALRLRERRVTTGAIWDPVAVSSSCRMSGY
jgi:hypothetical protein